MLTLKYMFSEIMQTLALANHGLQRWD